MTTNRTSAPPWREREAEVRAREASANKRRQALIDRLTAEAHANPDETARPRPGWRLLGVKGRPRRQIWEGTFGKRYAVVFGNGKPGTIWIALIREGGIEYEAAGSTLGIAMGVAEFYATGKLVGDMQPIGSS